MKCWKIVIALCLAPFFPHFAAAQSAPAPADALVQNSNFETDADGDQWPDGWPKLKVGGSWVAEAGNHFLRLTSPQPGTTVMLYREIAIPAGTKAIEIKWRQRITGLKVGAQPWFDARIMMEFMDATRQKVAPSPKAPAFRKDIPDWTEASTTIAVPEGAKTLKFMPSLFQVAAGTWDIDDMVIRASDVGAAAGASQAPTANIAISPSAGPGATAAPKASVAANAPATPTKVAAAAAATRQVAGAEQSATEAKPGKAEALLSATGSLITNGNFESDKKGRGWPDDWGHLKEPGSGSWDEENGNHYLHMTQTEPGKLIMMYRPIEIPKGTQALELTWRQRVTGLKKGEKPWFDARIMMEFKDAQGKKITGGKPSPPYTQKDTNGWVEKSTKFLVPDGAVTLEFMPALFQVQAGTFDLDDISLKPTDPGPVLALKAENERAIAARYVPPEEPNKAKWPKMLKVAGNRLHDTDDKEVWLQGVNVGGMETLPNGEQVIKSTVVAIDDWKANCVRLPIHEDFWFGTNAYQNDQGQGYRKAIDQIVTLAANRGAYVVVDLHRFRAPKQEHADFWKDFANVYKNHPAVLFDIFNEPHGISWEVWKNGGFVGNSETKTDESAFLTDEEKKKNQGFQSVGMQGLVDAVRSTGAKNIIVAGGIGWANDLSGVTNGYALDDKGGNGIMYSWHTYNWHKGWEKVLPAVEKYPIFLGEVGADTKKMDFIPADQQENPYTWAPDMIGFIQKYKINWTAWCLHPRATPVLISDWNYTPTPYWGAFVKRALSGEHFDLTRVR